MSANFSWLIMSNHKDDIRIINATSDINACLSYFHLVNQTEGSNVMHYRDGKLFGYSIVLKAADDFFKKKYNFQEIQILSELRNLWVWKNAEQRRKYPAVVAWIQNLCQSLRREILFRYDYLFFVSLKSQSADEALKIFCCFVLCKT